MCFRPAEAAQSRTCPECDGTVNAVGGFLPPKCPYCGHVFADGEGDLAPAPGAPAAPAAPGAPKAPAAPGTPPSHGAPPVHGGPRPPAR
ncbi:MAG: hypothetical protein HFJ75_01060 [Eggerthellaceae bacterium]|nr:hypothetical protein [Eggerthellaceae bacterium]